MSFNGLDGLNLLPRISELAVSTTSACTSASIEPSYVLRALGVCRETALSSVRISLGRYTTEEDVTRAILIINKAIHNIIEGAV